MQDEGHDPGNQGRGPLAGNKARAKTQPSAEVDYS